MGGPVYEVSPVDGALTLLRADRLPAEAFAEIEAARGTVQINHPTTYPSSNPVNRRRCRGCPWDFTPAETDYARVDAIEVHNGSLLAYGFTPPAIAFWEAALAAGHRIAAVGVSDSHKGGCTRLMCDATQSPIGQATTVVYAEQLSEPAILAGIRAGHTYVKLWGNAGPDLRFSAAGDQGGAGIMGDAIADPAATLHAVVSGLAPEDDDHELVLIRDGAVLDAITVSQPGAEHDFRAETPGRYRLQLESAAGTIVAMTSPIYVPEPGAAPYALAAVAALAALRGCRRGSSAG
jgi:hypothetical protein